MCSILFRGSLLTCSFFALRHWSVSQVFTPRMSPSFRSSSSMQVLSLASKCDHLSAVCQLKTVLN